MLVCAFHGVEVLAIVSRAFNYINTAIATELMQSPPFWGYMAVYQHRLVSPPDINQIKSNQIKQQQRETANKIKRRKLKEPTLQPPQICTETYTLIHTLKHMHADTQTHTLTPTHTVAGPEAWRKLPLGGQPHWERSRSKAAGSAATETTQTRADRRPRTKVQSPLAT